MILKRPAVVQVCCWRNFLFEFENNFIVVLQVEVLFHRRTSRLFVVATTHLHFDPLDSHIKLAQTCVCARHVLAVADDVQKRHPTRRVLVVFAGDLNVTPDSPSYTLLSTGQVSRDAAADDWRCIDRPLSTSGETVPPTDNDKVCC
jgi:endonuclease/exonuclease/phosphatase family metal-dependent hydrolase